MNNLGTGKGDPSRRRQRPKGQRPTGLEIWNGFARGLDAVAHALTWFFRKAAAFLVRAVHLGAALSVLLLAITALLIFIYMRFAKLEDMEVV